MEIPSKVIDIAALTRELRSAGLPIDAVGVYERDGVRSLHTYDESGAIVDIPAKDRTQVLQTLAAHVAPPAPVDPDVPLKDRLQTTQVRLLAARQALGNARQAYQAAGTQGAKVQALGDAIVALADATDANADGQLAILEWIARRGRAP